MMTLIFQGFSKNLLLLLGKTLNHSGKTGGDENRSTWGFEVFRLECAADFCGDSSHHISGEVARGEDDSD